MDRWLSKLIFVLLCAAPLGACGNFVSSERPLFTAADEVGAVPLRAGIWGGHEPDCVFDAAKPIEDWPNCAGGFAIGRKGLKSPGLELSVDRVAAGDPMIAQLGEEDGAGYTYVAVEVKERDRRGRATAILAWPVQCGPRSQESAPAPDGSAPSPDVGQPAPPAPRELFPGLLADGQNCLATDPAVVRKAASMSKATAAPVEVRWLRAGGR